VVAVSGCMSACLGGCYTQPTSLLVFCSRHRGFKSANCTPTQRQGVSPRASHHLCSNQHRHRHRLILPSEAASSHVSTAGNPEAEHEQGQQDDGAQEQHSPWLLKQHLSECPVCSGTGRCLCKDCAGSGFLQRGGYSKKNPLNLSRAVGEHWHIRTKLCAAEVAETVSMLSARCVAARRCVTSESRLVVWYTSLAAQFRAHTCLPATPPWSL